MIAKVVRLLRKNGLLFLQVPPLQIQKHQTYDTTKRQHYCGDSQNPIPFRRIGVNNCPPSAVDRIALDFSLF